MDGRLRWDDATNDSKRCFTRSMGVRFSPGRFDESHYEKKGDLKYGHTKQQRVAAWFKFKKAVHQLNGDRSEDLIRTLAMTKLGASPYLQMRAKQWMELLKQQKLELEADMNNRRANTEGDIQSSTGSKYAAAMQIAANEEQATN